MSGRKQGRRCEEWIWMFQGHLEKLALDRRMRGAHWRVLMYVLSQATFAQDMTFKQRDVAEALGVAFQTISRALRDLHEVGILRRVETHRYPLTYRLNSEYVYKGRGERLPQRRAYQRLRRV